MDTANMLTNLKKTSIVLLFGFVLTACGSGGTSSPSEVVKGPDADNDGISDALDQCPDTVAGTVVDETGCDFEYEGDEINVNNANPAWPSFTTFNDTTPAGKKWQKVENLSDEFASWDASKWQKTTWNYGNTPVFMQNQNSGVTAGNLWIKATLNEESNDAIGKTADQWFESSRVRSKAKIKFPMYTESRIKVANISAYSTYWLNNGDINNRDEIDIIEINPAPTYTGTRGEYVYADYPWEMHSQYFIVQGGEVNTERDKGNSINKPDDSDLSANNTLHGVRWIDDYHVFGMWWKDEHNVQFYLNGEPVGSVQTITAFSLEQSIIWDLWTQDSNWIGGLPAKNDLLNDNNNTMKVDWIRTWTLVDE